MLKRGCKQGRRKGGRGNYDGRVRLSYLCLVLEKNPSRPVFQSQQVFFRKPHSQNSDCLASLMLAGALLLLSHHPQDGARLER